MRRDDPVIDRSALCMGLSPSLEAGALDRAQIPFLGPMRVAALRGQPVGLELGLVPAGEDRRLAGVAGLAGDGDEGAGAMSRKGFGTLRQ